jgi:hypothetical protein
VRCGSNQSTRLEAWSALIDQTKGFVILPGAA